MNEGRIEILEDKIENLEMYLNEYNHNLTECENMYLANVSEGNEERDLLIEFDEIISKLKEFYDNKMTETEDEIQEKQNMIDYERGYHEVI